ncbi:putative transcription regulator, contains HTH domain (MarR family) [Cupriavidus gilardii CR3]|uniref:Winged helix DNA-binding protein n=1 Tax=Cupriavidus gilardii TaxID=82541 RepID=A0A6N1BH52_9BURK|nr:winged helix DNA-binding protein [Cupriavidus gilardii]ALD90749.1 putative transcription regulator, contains HTH domain (MarR family) [Cupriavidus gilardii CR3]KAB0597830.1 winged helix DNA-binding protein [Cupriavidus gilardii]MCT9015427.1 winged helix DNA-binding protein [Cupriavidus gilardii]MCT9055197.1 winged helix DNA-binding protein [Cupriavidus gilardii]MCT9071765.1 winged helix DNA-binding protein [Cupriavidus gilardii]
MARKPSRRDDVASHDIAAADVVSAGTASAAAAEAVVRSSSAGIVSSAHLVSSRSPELSEFEFGLNTAYNAYSRWVVRCMGAAGVRDLTFLDVLVLHHVNHRGRAKRLADICFVLNVEDTHLVTYSLKKLQGMGLVAGVRVGKEATYSTTAAGTEACARYREIREQCLTSNMTPGSAENAEIGELARLLRVLTGLYEQAARSATSL